jgi:hypothetical protein
MARRTCDEVDEGVEVDAIEFGGRMDCEVGRRSGYVFTDPSTSVPDDLELSLRVLLVVALLVASIASLDFFPGCEAGFGGI